MRYALRKLDKIASAMGEDYLNNHILKSLDRFFTRNDDDNVISSIELDAYQTRSGDTYSVLRVNDLADSDAMLEFAVVGQQYDVLKLSFLGRMKG